MPKNESEQANQSGPIIRWGKIDSICIYYVTEDEIDALENGSPESLYLNIALFAIATFFSFLVSLLTTTISDTRVYLFFISVAVASFITGAILFILWYRSHKSSRKIFNKIRERLAEAEKNKLDAAKNIDPTSTLDTTTTQKG